LGVTVTDKSLKPCVDDIIVHAKGFITLTLSGQVWILGFCPYINPEIIYLIP